MPHYLAIALVIMIPLLISFVFAFLAGYLFWTNKLPGFATYCTVVIGVVGAYLSIEPLVHLLLPTTCP